MNTSNAIPYFSLQTAGMIVAGRDSLSQLASRIPLLGSFRHAVILTQPSITAKGIVEDISGSLRQLGIQSRWTTKVKPEPTVDNIREVLEEVRQDPVDLVIGIGGGSVLDAAKLISVLLTNPVDVTRLIGTDLVQHPGVPTILIPTTSGTGSEVTPNAIVTVPEEQLKIGIVSRHLLPKLVVLDPVVTISLPKPITAATGMDAFTHALESYISNKANPFSDMFALESIRLISSSLVACYHDGANLEARERMLLGSMYGGLALSTAGTAAVHALAYPLGGQFHITHGVANSMLLPHVMSYNMDSIGGRLERVGEAMGLTRYGDQGGRAAEAVLETIGKWTEELHIPQDLRGFGVTEADVDGLAAAASKVTRLLNNNPKAMDLASIQAVYRKLLP